jgi:hypothetical protein
MGYHVYHGRVNYVIMKGLSCYHEWVMLSGQTYHVIVITFHVIMIKLSYYHDNVLSYFFPMETSHTESRWPARLVFEMETRL